MMIQSYPRHRAIVLALSGSLWLSSAQADFTKTAGPTINLFPTSVVENLQQSAESARAMENSMEGIVAKLDNQMALYQESHCDRSDMDAGCSQIKRGLSDTYTQMLDQMAAQLPAMKQAMQSTAKTLGKNLRLELGKKMTPLDLQRLIQGKASDAQSVRQRNGKRQGRMSSMLSAYHKLITVSSHNKQSQAMLAAEFYADASETLEYIDLIQMEIDQSKVIGGLSSLWNGEPSEQMTQVVGNVKALLFGEIDDSNVIPDTPMNPNTTGLNDSQWIID
jgi:hypothetical protein